MGMDFTNENGQSISFSYDEWIMMEEVAKYFGGQTTDGKPCDDQLFYGPYEGWKLSAEDCKMISGWIDEITDKDAPYHPYEIGVSADFINHLQKTKDFWSSSKSVLVS